MRIDDLAVALRTRNPWESFDLGLALARHTGLNLFLAFALPYCAIAALINLAAWGHPTAAMLIVWWLKPMFDRIALQVLSQSVFGEAPSWGATLARWRSVPRTGLAYALTFGRFDFARSFHLPVMQLEGQAGSARRERCALLDRKVRGHAVWLSVVVMHFIYVLIFGLDGLIKLFAPAGAEVGLGLGAYFGMGGVEPALASQYLFNTIFVVAECLLEPLYVAAGFSLYLSRRTALEGWDLEVAFKRLAARHAALAKTAAALVLLFIVAATPGQDALAQAAVPASTEKKTIEDILASPEFNQHENRMVWRKKAAPATQQAEQAERASGKSPDFEFWKAFARIVAEALRIIAWILAVALIAWLLFLVSRRLGWFKGLATRRSGYKPDVLFGLDLRPESLPDDIPAAARAQLAAGDLRAALSLLYRGALRCLIHEREVEVSAGDTEGECVRSVKRALAGAPAEYFNRLVDAWRRLAYGGRPPDAPTATALVDEWARHFAPAPDGSA